MQFLHYKTNRMRLFLLLFSIISLNATAQNVGIGTTSPDASAALDVSSTSKGVLVPRVSSLGAITNPAKGLLVFYTPENKFYFFDGSVWKDISQSSLLSTYLNAPNESQLNAGNANDSFGYSVAIGTGGYSLIGAPGKEESTLAGAGQLYYGYRVGQENTYGLVKLSAPVSAPLAAGDRFGAAVALSKTYGQDAVVGAPFKNTSGVKSGAAYYYYIGGGGTNVAAFPAPTTGLAANDLFGWSVAVSGYSYATNKALAVIGAPGDDGGYGRIYTYYRAPSGSYAYDTTLIDAAGVNIDQMGYSVACYINETTGDGWAFAGAPVAAAGGTERGKVIVFKRNGTTNTWSTFQTISGTTSNGNFGKSIDYDTYGTSQLLAVGEPSKTGAGKISVFRFDTTSNLWTLQTSLFGNSGNKIGEAVSISLKSSSVAYVAAGGKDGRISGNINTNWGVAQIYKLDSGTWKNLSYLYDKNGGQNYLYGNGISIAADGTLISGSPGAYLNGNAGQGKVIYYMIE